MDFPAPPRWIFVKSLRESLAWGGTVLVLAKDAAALNEVAPSSRPTRILCWSDMVDHFRDVYVLQPCLTPSSRIPDCSDGGHAITARSFHAGGVHVLMGDGAVRFVSESVHLPVWRSLASLYGAETVSDF